MQELDNDNGINSFQEFEKLYEILYDFLIEFTDLGEDQVLFSFQDRIHKPKHDSYVVFTIEKFENIGSNIEKYVESSMEETPNENNEINIELQIYTLNKAYVKIEVYARNFLLASSIASNISAFFLSQIGIDYLEKQNLTPLFYEDWTQNIHVNTNTSNTISLSSVLTLSFWSLVSKEIQTFDEVHLQVIRADSASLESYNI